MVNRCSLISSNAKEFTYDSISSLFATKVAVGTILLGISCEYVSTCRKESSSNTNVTKEPVNNPIPASNERLALETTPVATASTIDKSHGRSMSVVDLNELVHQRKPAPSKLPVVEGGDELNETSFRDAEDNYQCLINDQNCPPVPHFSKASSSNPTNTEPSSSNSNAVPFTTISNKDEGIVFTTSTSTANKKTDIKDVERFKMCGNSIII